MSIRYVAAVLDHLPALKNPTDALVLIAIAEYASDDTRLAWPSIGALVRRTRLHRRNVQRALRRLEALKLLATTIGGHVDGINTASCYRLEFDYEGKVLAYNQSPKRAAKVVHKTGRHTAAPGAALQPKGGGTPPPPQRHTAASTVIGTVIEPKSVQSTRAKRIPKAEPMRDLSAEKDRQLAALAALTIANTKTA